MNDVMSEMSEMMGQLEFKRLWSAGLLEDEFMEKVFEKMEKEY